MNIKDLPIPRVEFDPQSFSRHIDQVARINGAAVPFQYLTIEAAGESDATNGDGLCILQMTFLARLIPMEKTDA